MSRLGLSQKLDRGKNRLIAISSLTLYGVGLALIPHADHAWHLGIIGLGCGVSHGLYYPALSSFAAARFHPLHTGNAMSLYMSAFSLGMFLGSPILGVHWKPMGIPLDLHGGGPVCVLLDADFPDFALLAARARRLIWPYSAVTSQK